MANCRSCGRTVPDAKFCQECGAALTAPARSPASERRVVTVLFCDLVGFTSRSELLDPEDVRAFLVPYYDLVVAEVERHGGVVDKFTGDGAMVVFGVPTAHEDDPERAIRMGLRLLELVPELGLELHVRVGVNTGEVLFAVEAYGRGRRGHRRRGQHGQAHRGAGAYRRDRGRGAHLAGDPGRVRVRGSSSRPS